MAANDSSERIAGSYTVTEFSSKNIISQGSFELEPDTISVLDTFKVCTTQKELYLIEAVTSSGERLFNHYLAGYPQFDYNAVAKTYFNSMFEELEK